jgi:uncharacterized protein YjgD (DUF1641 family)
MHEPPITISIAVFAIIHIIDLLAEGLDPDNRKLLGFLLASLKNMSRVTESSTLKCSYGSVAVQL